MTPPRTPSRTPIDWARDRAGSDGRPSAPPEGAHADRFAYGLFQPLLALRLLLAHADLLRAALIPAAGLAVLCLLYAEVADARHFGRAFFSAFAVLAPVPSILFAQHYSRLAAAAHARLGLGERRALDEGLFRALRRAAGQMVLIAIGIAPFTAMLRLVPLGGATAVKAVAAAWALYWVVFDAFDSARTLAPGETLADVDRRNLEARPPWFVRLLRAASQRLPAPLRGLGGAFAALCDRLARPLREELALGERHPTAILGFALTTALLLATPVLNLLFRPIVIIAAVHLGARLHPDGVRQVAPAVDADPVA
jgi:hypothetical protein